jgi:hypothetical protein
MLATRLLFLNPPVKFDLIKMRNAADWWVPDVRISEYYVCYMNFIFVPRDAGYLALPMKFDLIRLRDAADRWVQDVRLSEKKHVLCWIYFIPRDCCILEFFEPAREI